MFMLQCTLEKFKEDLQRKDNDLWKMTQEKEQYQGKAVAGDATVKSQQVLSICVIYTCLPCVHMCSKHSNKSLRYYDNVYTATSKRVWG